MADPCEGLVRFVRVRARLVRHRAGDAAVAATSVRSRRHTAPTEYFTFGRAFLGRRAVAAVASSWYTLGSYEDISPGSTAMSVRSVTRTCVSARASADLGNKEFARANRGSARVAYHIPPPPPWAGIMIPVRVVVGPTESLVGCWMENGFALPGRFAPNE